MTAQEYWHGETWLIRGYLEGERMRQEREEQNAWMYGAFVRHAIMSSIGNAFLEKGATPCEYPPYPDRRAEAREKEKQKREDNELAFAKAWMFNFVRAGKDWGGKP